MKISADEQGRKVLKTLLQMNDPNETETSSDDKTDGEDDGFKLTSSPYESDVPFLWIALIGLLVTALIGIIQALGSGNSAGLIAAAISLGIVALIFKKG